MAPGTARGMSPHHCPHSPTSLSHQPRKQAESRDLRPCKGQSLWLQGLPASPGRDIDLDLEAYGTETALCPGLGEASVPLKGTSRGDAHLGETEHPGHTPSEDARLRAPLGGALHGHPCGCALLGPPPPASQQAEAVCPRRPRLPTPPRPSMYSLASRRVVSSSCVVWASPAPSDAIRKCASLKSRTWSRLCFRVTDRTSCHRWPTETPGDTGGHPRAWHERGMHSR